MSSHDDTRPGAMTDTQLDQLLAAANRELLGHIEATAAPVTAAALLEAVRNESLFELAPVMAMKVEEQLPELVVCAIVALTGNPGVAVPSGMEMFGPGDDAGMWDKIAERGKYLGQGGLLGPDGFDLPQMIKAMAIAGVRAAERRAGHGPSAAAG